MTDLIKLRTANLSRWHAAHPTRAQAFTTVARRLMDPPARAHYEEVELLTTVPWPIIAVIHERESSQDWHGSLAQGDPWNRISTHVPASRGPFSSWKEAAVDALIHCAPFAASNKDWTPGGGLTLLESYNGLGYASRGVASPYVWSGTDQYHGGKYVRDGVFDAHAFDQQLGCAGLLLAMMALDPAILPEWRA